MSEIIGKVELVDVIAQENGLTKAEATRQLEAVIKGMTSVIESGKGFKLIGFLTAEIKDVPEKEHKLVRDIEVAKAEGRPVKTTVTPAHKTVKAKFSKTFIKSIN